METAAKQRVNRKYTHFAVLKSTHEVVNGWDYKGYEQEELMSDKKYYFLNDITDMQIDSRLVKIYTAKYLLGNLFDPFNIAAWNTDKSIFTL
jgi:hypothetical protein